MAEIKFIEQDERDNRNAIFRIDNKISTILITTTTAKNKIALLPKNSFTICPNNWKPGSKEYNAKLTILPGSIWL